MDFVPESVAVSWSHAVPESVAVRLKLNGALKWSSAVKV